MAAAGRRTRLPQPPPVGLFSKLSATRGGSGSSGVVSGGDLRRGRLGVGGGAGQGGGDSGRKLVTVMGSAFGVGGDDGERAAVKIQRVLRGHWGREDARRWIQDLFNSQQLDEGPGGDDGQQGPYYGVDGGGEEGQFVGDADQGDDVSGVGGAAEGRSWTWEDYASYSEELREQGALCLAQGDIDAAADWLSQAIEYNQDNVDALASRCACYLRQKEFLLAAADAKVLSEKDGVEWTKDGNQFRGLALKGAALLGLGDAEGAEESFMAAQKMQPRSQMVADGLRAAREILSLSKISEEGGDKDEEEVALEVGRWSEVDDHAGELNEERWVLDRPWLHGPGVEEGEGVGRGKGYRGAGSVTSASEQSITGVESEWSSIPSDWQDQSDATASEAEDLEASALAPVLADDTSPHHNPTAPTRCKQGKVLLPAGQLPTRNQSSHVEVAALGSSVSSAESGPPHPPRGDTPLRDMSLNEAVTTCQASLRRAASARIVGVWRRWQAYGGGWQEGVLAGGEVTRRVEVVQAAARRRLVWSMYGANSGSRLWVARAASRQGGRHLPLNDMLRQSILSDGGVFLPQPGSTRMKTPGQKANEVAETFLTSLAGSSFLSQQSTLTHALGATAVSGLTGGAARPGGLALTGLAATLPLSRLPRTSGAATSFAAGITGNSRWLASRSREAIQAHVGVRPGTSTLLSAKGAYVRRAEGVHRLRRPPTPRRADMDAGAQLTPRLHLAMCSLAPAPKLDTRRGGLPLVATCSTTPSVEPGKPRRKARGIPDAALQVAAATRLEAQLRMALAHIRAHALMAALMSEHFGALRIQHFWRAIESRPFARIVEETVRINAQRTQAAILIQKRIARGPQARAIFAKMVRWKRLRLTKEQIEEEKLAWARRMYISRGHRARFALPAQKLQAVARRCMLNRKYRRYQARRKAMTEEEKLWDDMRLQSAMEHSYWRQMRPGDWRGGGNKKRTRPEMLHHNRGGLIHWWYSFQEDDLDESVAKMTEIPARQLTRLVLDQVPNHPDASLSPPTSTMRNKSPSSRSPKVPRSPPRDVSTVGVSTIHCVGESTMSTKSHTGASRGTAKASKAKASKASKPALAKGGMGAARARARVSGSQTGGVSGSQTGGVSGSQTGGVSGSQSGGVSGSQSGGVSGSQSERGRTRGNAVGSSTDRSAFEMSGWTERSSVGSVTERSRARHRSPGSNTGQTVVGGVTIWMGGVGPGQGNRLSFLGGGGMKSGLKQGKGVKEGSGLQLSKLFNHGGRTAREIKVEQQIKERRRQDLLEYEEMIRPSYVSKIPKLPYITSPASRQGMPIQDAEVVVQGTSPREKLHIRRQMTPEGYLEESFGVYVEDYVPTTSYLSVSRDEAWGFAETTASLKFGNGALRSAARSIARELEEGARRDYYEQDNSYC